MAKLTSPCYLVEQGKDCPFRTIGCHSTCKAYKAFKAEVEKVNTKARARINAPVEAYEHDRHTRALRNGGTLHG